MTELVLWQSRGVRVLFAAVALNIVGCKAEQNEPKVVQEYERFVSERNSCTTTAECTEIQGFIVYDLGVGTYHARLGPAVTSSSVSIVVESGEHDH